MSKTTSPALRIISHPLLYACLGIFYGVLFITSFSQPITITDILFGCATILLTTHILYGGYFLFKYGKTLDTIIGITSIGVLSALAFFVQSSTDPKSWFMWLAITFIIALGYHQQAYNIAKDKKTKEFCTYKKRIEIEGIVQAMGGYAIAYVLPKFTIYLGILNILTILWINYRIITKDALYRLMRWSYRQVP